MSSDQAANRQILAVANDLTQLAECFHRLSDTAGCRGSDCAQCAADCQEVLQRAQAHLITFINDHR